MSKVLDFNQYINAEYPVFTLMGKEYTIHNDKVTMLRVAQLQKDAAAGKLKKDTIVDDELCRIILGAEKGQELVDILATNPNFAGNDRGIIYAILAAANNMSVDEYKKMINAPS